MVSTELPSLDTCVVVPPRVMFRDLHGEAVLLELDSGQYFGLDEVGTRFWSALGEHGAIRPAIDALLAEFEVSRDRLEGDVLTFVARLASHRLIELTRTDG